MTSDSEHLTWIYNRLIQVYGEMPCVDYMRRLDRIIQINIASERRTKITQDALSKCGDKISEKVLGDIKKYGIEDQKKLAEEMGQARQKHLMKNNVDDKGKL